MPLFSRNHNTTPATAQPVNTHQGMTRTSAESHRSSGGGLFSSRRRRTSSLSSSDRETKSHSHRTTTTTTTSPTTSTGNGLSSLFHRSGPEDPSLVAARERVAAAEQAELEADRALAAARVSVREARDHVRAIEKEAAEEARLAKIKQQGAKDLGKRARPLGRHGRY